MTLSMQKQTATKDFAKSRFEVPFQASHHTERAIANHNRRAVVIGVHEVQKIAKNSEKFAKAFEADCFIFETKEAHDIFFKYAHPIAMTKISMGTLGYLKQSSEGKSHPIFSLVDCVICIGHPQSKIMADIRKENKTIFSDPIDFDALIAERAKRKQSYNQIDRKPLPI